MHVTDVLGEPEGGAAPVLHDDFGGLLARLAGVPGRLRHEERVLGQRLLLVLGRLEVGGGRVGAPHVDVALTILLGVVVEPVARGRRGARGVQAAEQGVLPEARRGVPVLDDGVAVHVVADLEARAGDEVLVAEAVARRVGGVNVGRGDGGLGGVLAREAGAREAVARVEDDGGDLICGRG